ncbi:AHH domain-containing protein [Priestia megaterium]|uniref:AHH domain-containing protein n=1 Tax=Priestia megaterium TaxID=1404 RepID=UPI002FFE8701
MELNKTLKLLNLNEYSTKGLEMATSYGMIDPKKWSGKLICPSGDITHLTDRELRELDEFLKNGKDVETDEIKKLKQQAHNLSKLYSCKIGQNNGWVLKLDLKGTASSRLRKELENIGVKAPEDRRVQAHHIIPFKQGEMAPILQKYGISVDSAANGVFLPEVANKYWPGEVTHSSYANNKMFCHGGNYIKYLQDRLNTIEKLFSEDETKRDHILDLLNETRTYLLTGELDFLYQHKQPVFFEKKDLTYCWETLDL